MTHILFESPLKLIIAEFVAALILLWWARRSAVLPVRLVIGYPALAVGLLVLQALVVTDAEKIRKVTRELAHAVDFGELEVIRGHLADEFETWGHDRDEFIDFVHQQLQVYRVDEVWVGGAELHIEGDLARMDFTARARVGTAETGIHPYWGRWRLDLRRHGKEWRVTRIENLAGPGAPTAGPPTD